MTDDIILQLKNVKYHSSNGSLDNFSISLRKGEVHVLLVQNLSEENILIDGLLHLANNRNSGEIIYNGSNLKVNPFYNNIISFLNHKDLLNDEVTVVENLFLPKLPRYKFTPFVNWRKMKRQSQKILQDLQLEFPHSVKVKMLSSEDKKLLLIAKIFLRNTNVIFLQEPMDGLSAEKTAKLTNWIKRFTENGGSVLYITKYWEETLNLAHRISVFSNGNVFYESTISEVKLNPQKLLNKLYGYNLKDITIKDKDTQEVLNAVFQATELLSSEYELRDVLKALAEKITKFMKSDGCTIMLIDGPTRTIIDEYEFKKNKHLEVELKQETINHIAEENNVFFCTKNNREFQTLFTKNRSVQTIIGVPVLIRKQITGIIQIYYEEVYVYSTEEAKYLSTLAHHVAIAIEETRLMGRSALLQESHHRIKNNLQSIVGLIALQKANLAQNSNISIDEVLDNIISKVKSIAVTHELLSKEKIGRSIVNVKDLIKKIIELMIVNEKVNVLLQVDDLFIPYSKATSIALIINELVTNALKHAFTIENDHTITVSCYRKTDEIFLVVEDNGKGLPENFSPNRNRGLGLTIIQGIVYNELHGNFNIASKKGTKVTISFHHKHVFSNYM